MEWKVCYFDLLLVPSSVLISIAYHIFLWRKVQSEPDITIVGLNNTIARRWIITMMKDNDKKNVLAVQTIRNLVMGVTLMATTAILICCGLAAVISSTYTIKKPLSKATYGADGEFMLVVKYVFLLFIFLFAFICYSLSVRFINQANFLVNFPVRHNASDASSAITQEYVWQLLGKGFFLNVVGNRLFYTALPLLLWIFGPMPAFLCSVVTILVLYNYDFIVREDEKIGVLKVQERDY